MHDFYIASVIYTLVINCVAIFQYKGSAILQLFERMLNLTAVCCVTLHTNSV